MEKELLTSESDFRNVIKNNGFYIDKTMFIEKVMKNAKVKLFIRPRRFGKILNLSMLEHFFY